MRKHGVIRNDDGTWSVWYNNKPVFTPLGRVCVFRSERAARRRFARAVSFALATTRFSANISNHGQNRIQD